VKYFAGTVDNFKKKYSKVFLIRNEEQFGIYSFKTGERFEPDYLLILGDSDPGKDTIFYQVFIESKGNQFIDSNRKFATGKEAWKEMLLTEITKKNIEHQVFYDGSIYKIWGLPFYNEANTLSDFDTEIKKLILS
jgi:type III restriction enzyme